MKTRDKHDQSNVDTMLSGGTFHMSEPLRQQLWDRLQTEIQKERSKPLHWPVFRPALVAVFVALFALVIISIAVVALSPKEKAASVVDGISEVYSGGLVRAVNETQTAGDISVTLDWAYADPNQILVAYTGQGASSDAGAPGEADRIEIQVLSAVLDDGAVLKGGPISGYTQPGTEATVAAFAMPENERNLETLQVRIKLKASHTRTVETPTPTRVSGAPTVQALIPMEVEHIGGGEVTFSVTIPVRPGRLIDVGKTVENKGIAVTLERVRLAPSLTIADLCFGVPDPQNYRDWVPIVTLSAAGREFSGAGSGYQVGATTICQRVQLRGSVPLDQTQYVLRVDELVGFKFGPGDSPTLEDHPEEQMRVKGPWEFEVK
jgi:hypothetical protein